MDAKVPGYGAAFAGRLRLVIAALGGLRRTADIVGVSDEQMARWRDGRSKPPFFAMIRLMEAHGGSLDWLAHGFWRPSEDETVVSLSPFAVAPNVQSSSHEYESDPASPVLQPLAFIDLSSTLANCLNRCVDNDQLTVSELMRDPNGFGKDSVVFSLPECHPVMADVGLATTGRFRILAAAARVVYDVVAASRGLAALRLTDPTTHDLHFDIVGLLCPERQPQVLFVRVA